MKTTVVSVLLAGSLLAVAAWLANAPKPADAGPDPKPAEPAAIPAKQLDTVQRGLDYLVGKQFPDGHWEGDGGDHPVAMTGLVGLSLLMSSPDPIPWTAEKAVPKLEHGDKHSASVRKAADWLMAQSQPGRDGLLFSNHPSETSRYMQGHGLATIFLAGVCRRELDAERRRKLTETLARAVKYIASAQSTQGGWHDTSRVEGHDFASIPVTAIEVQALQAAENAGIPMPPSTLNDGLEYLKASLKKDIEPAEMAAALACLHPSAAGGFVPASLLKRLNDCRSRISAARDLKFGKDELSHYYLSQSLHDFDAEAWKAYRPAMLDRLRVAQNADGSWPAGHGTCAGPVYAAAVWCMILQLDNGRHPSRREVQTTVF